MSNAWTPTNGRVLSQAIDATSTTQNYPLGTRVRAAHTTYGEGEFIYLAGSATAVANTVVYWKADFVATALPAVSTSKKTGRPVGVVQTTIAASSYGWVQIVGQVPVLKTAVVASADVAIYISATAGRIYRTASAGAQIVGARTINTSSVTTTTSTVLCYINNPAVQGYS